MARLQLLWQLCAGLGTVNLGGMGSFLFVVVGGRRVASGRCQCLPDREGSRSQESVIRRFQQVASDSEKIVDHTLEGEEPLGLTSRFESAHMPFPLAGRLMRGVHGELPNWPECGGS